MNGAPESSTKTSRFLETGSRDTCFCLETVCYIRDLLSYSTLQVVAALTRNCVILEFVTNCCNISSLLSLFEEWKEAFAILMLSVCMLIYLYTYIEIWKFVHAVCKIFINEFRDI
jgi:type III secretory pathway component EscU